MDASRFESIYTSQSFPPLYFGVPYNLPPDLRAQVTKAFVEFKFAGTSVEKRQVPQGKTRFSPVNYEKDWEYVRKIDDVLTHLLDGK